MYVYMCDTYVSYVHTCYVLIEPVPVQQVPERGSARATSAHRCAHKSPVALATGAHKSLLNVHVCVGECGKGLGFRA